MLVRSLASVGAEGCHSSPDLVIEHSFESNSAKESGGIDARLSGFKTTNHTPDPILMFITTALLLLAPSTPVEAAALPTPVEPLAESLYLFDDAEPVWKGSVNLGATISNGNTDTVAASVTTDAVKEWDDERLTLKAAWNYAEQGDTVTDGTNVTQRRWNASGKFDHFYSEETFAYASVSAENDDIAFLHLRTIFGAGVGRKFIQEETLKFEGEAGLAFVQEDYFSTPAGTPKADDDYLALRFAYALEKIISETTTFTQTMEAYPSVTFSEFNGVLDSRLKTKLSETMNAMIQWIARYNNNAPGGIGSTDTLWIFSLGWEY